MNLRLQITVSEMEMCNMNHEPGNQTLNIKLKGISSFHREMFPLNGASFFKRKLKSKKTSELQCYCSVV